MKISSSQTVAVPVYNSET